MSPTFKCPNCGQMWKTAAACILCCRPSPTTLHDRVADADRARAIEPPPFKPGNATWQAGYETAKAQAAALAATAGDPHMRILAMRPTAPKVTA